MPSASMCVVPGLRHSDGPVPAFPVSLATNTDHVSHKTLPVKLSDAEPVFWDSAFLTAGDREPWPCQTSDNAWGPATEHRQSTKMSLHFMLLSNPACRMNLLQLLDINNSTHLACVYLLSLSSASWKWFGFGFLSHQHEASLASVDMRLLFLSLTPAMSREQTPGGARAM